MIAVLLLVLLAPPYPLQLTANSAAPSATEQITEINVDNLATATTCVNPPPNMVAWWPGDGNANDSVGTNDGALQNGATFAAGKVGQAFRFDGFDDFVTFGNTIGNFGLSDFTIDFWIQTTSTRNEAVLEKRTVCAHASFVEFRLNVGGNIGKLFISLDQDAGGTNYNELITDRIVNDGQPHHVALVRQGNTARVYIDGLPDVSGTTAGVTNISNTANFTTGKSVCGSSFTFTGLLDEIDVFSRALSTTEIQSIFNADSRGKCTGGVAAVSAQTGGTVTDSRTGASATIAPYTLKAAVAAKVLTLDSRTVMNEADKTCDVPILPRDNFPPVPGFERATEVVRYEVDPCGSLAFAPGMELKLPILRAIRGRVTSATKLRLFQLGQSESGALAFRDTGVALKATTTNFAIADDVQPFGTYAGFIATSSPPADGMPLYFPAIINDPANKRTARLSIVNPDSSKQLKVSLTAYDGMGAKGGAIELSPLPARGQTSVRVSDLFPNLTSGAIVARIMSGVMIGLAEIADDFSNPTMWASAEAIRTPHSSLVFPVVEATDTSFTEVHIFNPSCDADAEPVEVKLRAFKKDGTPVNLLGSTQTLLLNPCSRLVMASRNAPVAVPDVMIPNELDGGYLSVTSSNEKQLLVGTELFGQGGSRKVNLAMLNGLPFPSGCLLTDPSKTGCQVDTSPQSPVPDAARQHTLYAPYFESNPASAELIVVNASADPARVAFSAFDEDGRFRATSPATETPLFTTLAPNQVLRTPVSSLFRFNPAPGYVRIEDPDSALVGVIINRDGEKYRTALALIPDVPELAQPNSQAFLSRIQLDPSSATPRINTGLVVFNPNNNPVPFMLKITRKDGTVKTSAQTAVARGAFTRARLSLSTLFTDSRDGYVEIMATSKLNPGETGRLIIVGVYRATTAAGIQATAAVGEQTMVGSSTRAP